MSDFQVNDVVVCVDDGPWRNSLFARDPMPLVVRHTYRVTERRGRRIAVAGLPKFAFAQDRFRKLNDGTDDAELIAKIKSCKPVRERLPA